VSPTDEPTTTLVAGRRSTRAALTARVAEHQELAATAIRFALVGLLKTALDFATFNAVLVATGADGGPIVLVANTARFCVSVASSFVLNARYTFRAPTRSRGFSRYVLVSAIGLALYNGSFALVLLGTHAEGPLALNLAKVVALGASMAWNFLGYRRFVFQSGGAAR